MQVSAAPAVLLHFVPKYTLGAIEPTALTVENNGWAPAEFKVQVLDRDGKPVEEEEVGWEVTGQGAEAVVGHSDKTDDQGWSRVWLTSKQAGTFDLEASWNNGAQKANGASVTFKETEPLVIGKQQATTYDYFPSGMFNLGVTGGSGAPIQCSSSDTSVLAAAKASTDDHSCHCVMKGSGSATLTVTQDETDQYQANSASCEITLNSQCQLLYASSVSLGQQRIVVTGGGASQTATLYVNGNHASEEVTNTTGRAEFVLDVDVPDETLSIMVDVAGAKVSGEMKVRPYPMYAEPEVTGGVVKAKVIAQKLDVQGVLQCPSGWSPHPDLTECCIKEDLMADASGVYVIDVNNEYSVKTKGMNIAASEATYTMEYDNLGSQAGSDNFTLTIANSTDKYKDEDVTAIRSSYKTAIFDAKDDSRKIEMTLDKQTIQDETYTIGPSSSAFPRIKVSFPDKASFPKNKEVDIYPMLYDKNAGTITGTFTKEVSLPMLKGFVINDAQ